MNEDFTDEQIILAYGKLRFKMVMGNVGGIIGVLFAVAYVQTNTTLWLALGCLFGSFSIVVINKTRAMLEQFFKDKQVINALRRYFPIDK